MIADKGLPAWWSGERPASKRVAVAVYLFVGLLVVLVLALVAWAAFEVLPVSHDQDDTALVTGWFLG
jgi:hypothetical protein